MTMISNVSMLSSRLAESSSKSSQLYIPPPKKPAQPLAGRWLCKSVERLIARFAFPISLSAGSF
jgi:hypothetical protein